MPQQVHVIDAVRARGHPRDQARDLQVRVDPAFTARPDMRRNQARQPGALRQGHHRDQPGPRHEIRVIKRCVRPRQAMQQSHLQGVLSNQATEALDTPIVPVQRAPLRQRPETPLLGRWIEAKNAAVIASPDSTPVKIAGHYLMYYGKPACAPRRIVKHGPRLDRRPGRPAVPAELQPHEVCVAVTDYQTTARGPVQHNINLFVAGQLMGQGRWFYAISEVEMSGTTIAGAGAAFRCSSGAASAVRDLWVHAAHRVHEHDHVPREPVVDVLRGGRSVARARERPPAGEVSAALFRWPPKQCGTARILEGERYSGGRRVHPLLG